VRNLTIVQVAVAARISASGNGAAVDVRSYSGEARLVLNSSATGAADNTLNTKIQHSDDGSTNWVDSGISFQQIGNTAPSHQVIGVNVDRFKRYIRAVDTLAGTAPNVTRAVLLIAKSDR
jgi:hypothetical protein